MKPILALSLLLLAVGCVTAKVRRLDQVQRPERAPDAVQVLREAPERPYAVIAVVESKTDAVFKGFDDLRRKLQIEAAKLGGDAVLLGEEVKESSMLLTATAQIQTEQKKLTGKVIVFSHRGRSDP